MISPMLLRIVIMSVGGYLLADGVAEIVETYFPVTMWVKVGVGVLVAGYGFLKR